MKKLSWISIICGFVIICVYITMLIGKMNDTDIIGAAGMPTFIFLIERSPNYPLILGIVLVIFGMIMLKKNKQ